MTATFKDLERILYRIDRRGYRAYREIKGLWSDGEVVLEVEHVQGDPFATPTRLRMTIPASIHGIPAELWRGRSRRIALCDFLLRVFSSAAGRAGGGEGMGHSGKVLIDAGNAEILERSGCGIDDNRLELGFRVGLPARGRSVLGKVAAELLTGHLPRAAGALRWERLDQHAASDWVRVSEDHAHLKAMLAERNLVSFIRDGSILPRASGISSKPLPEAVPFISPESLRVSLPTVNRGEITGMGVPEGVTLITGGGFHGKTTLLEAIQFGIYPHVPGDGREWVATRDDAVKVRSEDGRSVAGVDLRPFIHDLPGGRETASFTSQDASGSTSLAAAIMEALELGAGVLMLDEDTSATNLLIRDARMQDLVRRETITPLIDRVRELSETMKVSTILVVGGSGDYLEVADHVIMMEEYRPLEVDDEARRIVAGRPTGRAIGDPVHPLAVTPRRPKPGSFNPRRGRREKVRARGLRELLFGEDVIDLAALEQLVDDSQARTIGAMLKRLGTIAADRPTLSDGLEILMAEVDRAGIGSLDSSPELAMPRIFEVAGAVNRLRSLKVSGG